MSPGRVSVNEAVAVGQIKASVIIPTHNRKENLQKILGSLSTQTASPTNFEVIVVDDGSMDGSPRVADMWFPFHLYYLRQANQGSAAARNAGAEHASGELLIFLDDDMLVESGFVSGLLEAHEKYPDIVGMGSLRPYVSDRKNIFTRVYPLEEQLYKQRVFPVEEVTPLAESEFVSFMECVSNNLSVRKDDFFSIGGMQDVAGDGPTWWGDVDFGYRAYLKGLRFHRSGLAFCTHCDQSVSDLATATARQYKSAVLAVALFNKFPALQDQLPMFQDMLPIDPKIDPFKRVVRKVLRKFVSTWVSLRILTGIARFLERWYPSPALLRPLYRWILGGFLYQGYQAGLKKYGPADLPRSLFLAG